MVKTGGRAEFTIALFPFSTFVAFIFAFALGEVVGALALGLGFAVEFSIDFFHVHGSTSFEVGAARDKGFVGAGPAWVASFEIPRLVSAAG